MSRKPLPQQEYIVQKQEHGPSKVEKTLGEQMVTIFFRGSNDKRVYKTHIVESFRNLKQWESILERHYDKLRIQFDPGWLSGGNTIDADSRPFIIEDKSAETPVDIFNQDDSKVQKLKEDIAIMQGLVLTYEMYQAYPEILEQARARLEALQAQEAELIAKDAAPSITKMFFIPVDKFEDVNTDDPESDEKILAQICQYDEVALQHINMATRFEIVDFVETHNDSMEVSHIAAVVALWLKPEDILMLKLQGKFETI